MRFACIFFCFKKRNERNNKTLKTENVMCEVTLMKVLDLFCKCMPLFRLKICRKITTKLCVIQSDYFSFFCLVGYLFNIVYCFPPFPHLLLLLLLFFIISIFISVLIAFHIGNFISKTCLL